MSIVEIIRVLQYTIIYVIMYDCTVFKGKFILERLT